MKGVAAGLSGLGALALLLPMEAGVPVPLPADLVMFTVGERVAAGRFPLWLAVAGFEVVALAGTTLLFLACRGPAHRVIARYGPRLGLTEARVERAAAFAGKRGRAGLALGRATPGLRTLTVIAAGVSGARGRHALPALILGSSVFLQFHLVLGLLLGPLADRAFSQAKGPALAAVALLAALTVAFWLVRRHKKAAAAGTWREASCPVCLGLGLLAERVPGLDGLTGARPGPATDRRVPLAAQPPRTAPRPAGPEGHWRSGPWGPRPASIGPMGPRANTDLDGAGPGPAGAGAGPAGAGASPAGAIAASQRRGDAPKPAAG